MKRLLVVIFVVFINCDPALRLSYIVINDTSEKIKVKYSLPEHQPVSESSIYINSNDTLMIYSERRMGMVKYSNEYCSLIPWIQVYIDDKEILNDSSNCDSIWTSEIKKKYKSGGGELIYKLVIDSTKLKK